MHPCNEHNQNIKSGMKLYKFRSLACCLDLDRIEDIIENGFYCNDFLGFNDMNEGVYRHISNKTPIPLDVKDKFRICSFSGEKALDCELMWGHYANAGKGIVLEVELFESNVGDIKEVKYSDSRSVIDGVNEYENVHKILSNKSLVWCYEDEYRYVSEKAIKNNKIKIGKITKIYFGTPYENLKNYNKIKEKHIALKEYHKYRDKLKSFCELKKIEVSAFPFVN